MTAAWVFVHADDDPDEPLVCVTHQRSLPCRTCGKDWNQAGRWSADPAEVEAVRAHQNGEPQ